MTHFKRRKRRKGGVKGHCALCSQFRVVGLRNRRILTKQEKKAELKFREELDCKIVNEV